MVCGAMIVNAIFSVDFFFNKKIAAFYGLERILQNNFFGGVGEGLQFKETLIQIIPSWRKMTGVYKTSPQYTAKGQLFSFPLKIKTLPATYFKQ